MNTEIKLDRAALYLISVFENRGFSIYAVGGCVRDALLDRPVCDIDLAVSAAPDESKRVLSKNNIQYIETGLSHGTLTAVVGGRGYEITSFRTDGTYSDNRRPDSVSFVSDINVDLSRRDFTINAMAYNPREGIIDLFGGREDIKNGVIRAVGDPDMRFEEDSLRILRGLRFASVLDFHIDPQTAKAMTRRSSLLRNIARERVTNEVMKLLSGSGAQRILENYRDIIFCMSSEFPRLVASGTWECAVRTFGLLPANPDIRLAALILFLSQSVNLNRRSIKAVDISDTSLTRRILRTFRLKSVSSNYILSLMQYVSMSEPRDRLGVKKMLFSLGNRFYTDLLKLRLAVFSCLEEKQRCAVISKTLDTVDDIEKSKEVYNISELDINGNDLKNMGYNGEKIGRLLETVLDLVMQDKLKNNREDIIRYLLEKSE